MAETSGGLQVLYLRESSVAVWWRKGGVEGAALGRELAGGRPPAELRLTFPILLENPHVIDPTQVAPPPSPPPPPAAIPRPPCLIPVIRQIPPPAPEARWNASVTSIFE